MSVIYLFSLGQLSNPNLYESKNAFSSLLQEKFDYFPWNQKLVADIYISAALLLDEMPLIGYGSIKKYKQGIIDTKNFKKAISVQLGMHIEDKEFEAAWNAMCRISPQTSKKIIDILKWQANQDQHPIFIIPSATNILHYKYIKNQIDPILEHEGLGHLEDNKAIKISLSYVAATLDLNELAQGDIREFDQPGNSIVICHNGINKAELGIQYADIELKSFEQCMNGVNSYIDKAEL